MTENEEMRDLEIRLSLDPWDVDAYIEKAMLLNDRGKQEEVSQCLETAEIITGGIEDDLERKTIQSTIYFVRSKLEQEDPQKYLANLGIVIQLRASEEHVGYAYELLGDHFLKREEFDLATEAYCAAFQTMPTAEVLYKWAASYYKNDDYLGTLIVLFQHKEMGATESRFPILRAYAEYKLGNIKNATEELGNARELGKLEADQEELFAYLLKEPQENQGTW